ncbi:MAG: cellulase family glycosylhydrolase [Oscillospiraceae bacterium]|nr:cellulase family glycosylhydrolase [Oscillospiraceae bacterium]
MKHKHMLSLCMAAIITATGTVGFAGKGLQQPVTVHAAAAESGDDWLHAEGSRLFDKDGNEVWLTGANWFGLNCSENAPHGLYATEADPFLSAVADHGINIIRFPISSELIISWMNGEPNAVSSVQAWGDESNGFNIDFLEEDGKTIKNSQEIFDILLEKCKKYGLKCFIDVHSPHSDNSGHVWNTWYGKAGVTTESWIESLAWMAGHYANDDTILGYDLQNEPHGKGQEGDEAAKWDGSTDENNWAYAATQCANAILKKNPNALIFIEGVEQSMSGAMEGDYWGMADRRDNSPYIGAWWGGNLRGVREWPIKLDGTGNSQIVYSPHDYGPSVFNQTWFDKDFTEQTLLDDYWRDTWAYINEEEIAPLLIGEWGGHMDKGKNEQWMCLLRDYMVKHHINHTFWCLNPNSGDTGGLLGNDFKTWDNNKYSLFEKSLWKTQTSKKYIGLDHKVPLGSNGLSLSEFYASYANTEGSNIDGGRIGGPKGNPATIVDPPATTTKQQVTTTAQPTTTTAQPTTTTKVSTTTTVTTSVSTQPTTTRTTVTTTATTEHRVSQTTTSEPTVEQPGSVTTERGGKESPTNSQDGMKWGDANCDGTVDVSDAVLICKFISGDSTAKITETGISNASVTNGTKQVELEDVTKILKFITRLISAEELAPKK